MKKITFVKIVLVFLVALFCVVSVFAAGGTTLNFSQKSMHRSEEGLSLTPGLRIREIRQDPLPANPGEAVDIYMKIDNLGGSIAQPRFDFVLPSTFTLDPSSRRPSDLPSIEGGEKMTRYYKLMVDKNAAPGEYEVEFILYSGNNIYYPYYFTIKVDDVTSHFDVAMHEVTKDGVALAISNTGKNTANSITVHLDNQDDFVLLGPSSTIIGNLNAGDYTLVNALVAPKKEVTPSSSLTLNVELNYTDTIGNRRSFTTRIPVLMTSRVIKGFDELRTVILEDPSREKSQSSSKTFVYVSLALVVALVGSIVYYRKKLRARE